MNKHFVTLPCGTKATRNSKTREYSHCVAVLPSYAQALADATNLKNYKYAASNFHFHVREAEEQKYNSYPTIDRDEYRDKQLALNEGCTTAEEYIAHEMKRAAERVEASKASGYYDTYKVVGWCGRLDLAQKLAAQQSGYAAVQILEAQRA